MIGSSDTTNATSSCTERWCIAEIFEETKQSPDNSRPDSPTFMSDYRVNSEEELYYRGHTAVWTRGGGGGGSRSDEGVLPRIAFTCDTPIQHAFFCPRHFIVSTEPDRRKGAAAKKSTANDQLTGICLIDSTSMRVYLSTGEDYLTSLEFPVSSVWSTKFGILLAKNASNATVDTHSISMPRLFSLSHPLHEMSPLLWRPIGGQVAYVTEPDVQVVFAQPDTDLMLLYDCKTAKHFVAILRKASVEETSLVCAANNDTNYDVTTTSRMHSELLMKSGTGGSMKCTSLKFSNSGTGAAAATTSRTSLANRTNSPFMTGAAAATSSSVLSPSHHHRSLLNSPLDRLQSSGHTGGGSAFGMLSGGHSYSVLGMRNVEQPQMHPAKPIVPELCLEQVWIESTQREYLEMATHGFMHTDLIGQTFICYLLRQSAKLQLVRLEAAAAEKPIFGIVTSIPAKDAVCLRRMKMIAVLAPCGTLLLYTGPILIGKVHVGGVLACLASTPLNTAATVVATAAAAGFRPSTPGAFGGAAAGYPRRSSLLPASNAMDARFAEEDELHTLSPVHPLSSAAASVSTAARGAFSCGLRDAIGNRVTLTYPGGRMYRVSVPLMSECPFVTKCLATLRQVLRKDLAIAVSAKFDLKFTFFKLLFCFYFPAHGQVVWGP